MCLQLATNVLIIVLLWGWRGKSYHKCVTQPNDSDVEVNASTHFAAGGPGGEGDPQRSLWGTRCQRLPNLARPPPGPTSQATENTPDVHLFLLHALLLRIQSGTNNRHASLTALQWTDVEHHEYVVGLDTEMFSFKMKPCKILGKIAGPVEFYVTDVITSKLFSLWWHYFAPDSSTANIHHVYVFPHVASQIVFDFTKPLTYLEHGKACRMCADMLQLPVSREFAEHLGANSVRRGNAAKLHQEVKGGA